MLYLNFVISYNTNEVPESSASASTSVALSKGVKYSPVRKKEKLTASEVKLEPTTKLVYLNV